MPNVTTLRNVESLIPYLNDGVAVALRAVLAGLPRKIVTADSLTLYTATAVHTKVEIDDDAGSYPLAVIAQSKGTACWVVLFDLDADDVTVGTTSPDYGLPVSATSGDISAGLLLGNGIETKWTTGLTIAAPSTLAGSGAVANDPNVWILYHAA